MGLGCSHRVRVAVCGLAPMSGMYSSRLVYLLQPPFVCTTNGASQELFYCGLVTAFGYFVFVAPWERIASRPRSALHLIAQGYLVGTTK